ncbi:MAG: hypothetical protein WA418_13825 [Bradyrhizobium sp.]
MAGRLLVLAYLFCVLSPGVAMALGRGAAPCFDEATIAVAVSHHEMADTVMMPQMHAAHAHHHDHPAADAGMQARHAPAPAPSHHDHSKMPGPCCAMMCAVGLAVALPAMSLPAPLATASVTTREQSLPGRTPPRLDRPPIVLV